MFSATNRQSFVPPPPPPPPLPPLPTTTGVPQSIKKVSNCIASLPN